MTPIEMRDMLTECAKSLCALMELHGVDGAKIGFAVVVWPIGKPGSTSTISGSGNPLARDELSDALTAAGSKAASDAASFTSSFDVPPPTKSN